MSSGWISLSLLIFLGNGMPECSLAKSLSQFLFTRGPPLVLGRPHRENDIFHEIFFAIHYTFPKRTTMI